MPKSVDAPPLPGYDGKPGDWIRLASAAKILGCSRTNAGFMARDGKFGSLHKQDGVQFVSLQEVLSIRDEHVAEARRAAKV